MKYGISAARLLPLILSAPAVAQPEPSPAIIISGSPSELRLQRPLWGGVGDTACFEFSISSNRPQPWIMITTSGLREALLSDARIAGCGATGGLVGRPRLLLLMPRALESRRVAVRLAPSLVEAGSAVEGRIVAIGSSGTRETVAFKVSGEQRFAPFFTAVQWFLGFFIPALAGGILVQFWRWIDSRRSEKEILEAFRDLQDAALTKVCDELNPILEAEHMERPGQLAYDIFSKYKLLDALPRKARRKMTKYCRTNQMDAIVMLVYKIFPASVTRLVAARVKA